MKLKRQPEDFQVEELTQLVPEARGEHALYRLTKQNLGTPEAIDAILRRWQLKRNQVGYGGLKDRYALTTQYLTIFRGPQRDLRQTNLELEYLGRASRAFSAADISANRFQIVLRSLDENDAARITTAVPLVLQDGVPNYFDDQRFGSLGESGEFIARPWIAGDYERALWLALADSNTSDTADERREKSLLREHWGDWPLLKQRLSRSHRRSIVTYLCDHPQKFRNALALVRIDLRSIYVAAFQSFLWNTILADAIRQTCQEAELRFIESKIGRLPFYHELSAPARAQLKQLQIPLPSARLKLDEGPLRELIETSLARHGVALREIRLKYPRDTFFSKGVRDAVVTPIDLKSQIGVDELYKGRSKAQLSFDLARGAYATMLIKRLLLETIV